MICFIPAMISSADTSCSGRSALVEWPMSLMPSISTTQRSPGTARTSRSSLAKALRTENMSSGWSWEDTVAADPSVEHADRLGVRARGQPLRQPVGPAVGHVDLRTVAVGDEVAERDDGRRLAGGLDIHLIDEVSRSGGLGRGYARRQQ